jgi:hypothetical protein
MTLSCARSLALCVFAGTFAGMTGCKSKSVQAAGGGSSAPISGPPTYNQRFAARNPRVCSKVTTPPTLEQAKALVQCGDETLVEGLNARITLVTDLQVEMAPAAPFNPHVTHDADVDTSAPTYSLRGTGTRWICGPAATGPGSAEKPAGQNCMRNAAAPGGKGLCEKSTFGDWSCSMTTGGGEWDYTAKGPTDY